MFKIIILFSGRGSNMEAILKAKIPKVKVIACITDNSQAKGIDIVGQFRKPLLIIEQGTKTKEVYNAELFHTLKTLNPDLIVLAGFMRILPADICDYFYGKCINIHPSLLPNHKGLHTHKRALENGDKFHGATVHFVTKELDGGPPILQYPIPVREDDTEETLAERVLVGEHKILPLAVKLFSKGGITLRDGMVLVDFGAIPVV